MLDSFNEEDDQHILSDLRDEPTSFYVQELQSTYVSSFHRSHSFSSPVVCSDMSIDNAIR